MSSQDPEPAAATGPATGPATEPGTEPRPTSPWRVVARVTLVAVMIVLAAIVLNAAFDELEPSAIAAALGELVDAELLALGAMWAVWLACQGLQTAALVDGLPVRRGVLAFLGPTAVASVVPGPSDLPVRYRMFTSWGYSTLESGLAISAGGIFSIGIKLVLPVVASLALVIFGAPIDGTLRTLVAVAIVVGGVLAAAAYALGSPRRTAAAGRVLQPLWAATARLLRRDDPDHLSVRLVTLRAQSLDILRGRWLMATWGTLLCTGANMSLLLLALRFMDVPHDALSWPRVFVVFALVQGLTVVPVTAGSAGVAELAYIGLLASAAGPAYANQVAAGVILYRLLTWILIIPVGLGVLAAWRYGQRSGSGQKAATEQQ